MKHGSDSNNRHGDLIRLPEPVTKGGMSVEEAMLRRRSVRDYTRQPVTLAEVSQLLWAAQGITGDKGERTAPSAGATYPLEIYLVAGNVEGLLKGVYKYQPRFHALVHLFEDDVRAALAGAAIGQNFIKQAAVSIVITAVYERTMRVYGTRGIRYVHMDTAHAAQNIHLQAESLGLGTVVVGAFDDKNVDKILKLPGDEQTLYIMPIGRRR